MDSTSDYRNAPTAIPPVIQRWHRLVECATQQRPGFDVAGAIDDVLADDVVFESPAVHTPQRGKAVTRRYLVAALQVLNGPDWRYGEQWFGPASAVLEFETVVDGRSVNGVDIVRWNADGRIVHFKVMIRPLKGLDAVVGRMAALLGGPARAG